MNLTRTSAPRPRTTRRPTPAGKVESPADLSKHSWSYVLRKTMREFSKDQCTDLAAALTYYSVLALFPAVIALTSIWGSSGRATRPSTRCSTS